MFWVEWSFWTSDAFDKLSEIFKNWQFIYFTNQIKPAFQRTLENTDWIARIKIISIEDKNTKWVFNSEAGRNNNEIVRFEVIWMQWKSCKYRWKEIKVWDVLEVTASDLNNFRDTFITDGIFDKFVTPDTSQIIEEERKKAKDILEEKSKLLKQLEELCEKNIPIFMTIEVDFEWKVWWVFRIKINSVSRWENWEEEITYTFEELKTKDWLSDSELQIIPFRWKWRTTTTNNLDWLRNKINFEYSQNEFDNF